MAALALLALGVAAPRAAAEVLLASAGARLHLDHGRLRVERDGNPVAEVTAFEFNFTAPQSLRVLTRADDRVTLRAVYPSAAKYRDETDDLPVMIEITRIAGGFRFHARPDWAFNTTVRLRDLDDHFFGVLDWYLFLGADGDELLAAYYQVIGAPKAPPLWALGPIGWRDGNQGGATEILTAIWGGDSRGSWAGLAGNLANAIRSGFMGFPVWGTDVGGYFGGRIDEELYARWLQWGAWNGLFEIKLDDLNGQGADRPPWVYGPKLQAAFREAAGLRMRLLPYIYSLARTSARHGVLMKPLAYVWPADPATHAIWDEYLFGPAFLVAPLTAPGGRRQVYLPEDDHDQSKLIVLERLADALRLTAPALGAGGELVVRSSTAPAAATLNGRAVSVRYDDASGLARVPFAAGEPIDLRFSFPTPARR